ncbi:MAG: hypothetical protein J1G04_03890 [Clostridiales bacterium]|nr:hypothetical protein [Clostridiales bacterium]
MDVKKKKFNILFVCTGNTCRSPMAEFMFKKYLKDKKRSGDFVVSSAGLTPERGSNISDNAVATLELLGVECNKARKAKTFTVKMSMDADLIVAMTDRHAAECGDGDNVMSFDDFGAPIYDPYGGPLQAYIECAVRMRECFDAILAECDKRIQQ